MKPPLAQSKGAVEFHKNKPKSLRFDKENIENEKKAYNNFLDDEICCVKQNIEGVNKDQILIED